MMTKTFQVKIQHEVFGTLLSETFVNAVQFKLFLKMIQGCIELKQDLTFFNGEDFFIHVPYKNLNESIVTTFHETYTLAEHMINKSKIEAIHTK